MGFVFILLALPLNALRAQDVDFHSSDLPIVIINTNGQAIPDEPKIMADMGVIFNGEGQRNDVNDPFNHYDGKIGIEIRGSSSTMFPKKQYAVETRFADQSNRNVSIFGMPEENDWVLYAPYSDKSLIRNALAYHLARKMGRYASRTRFCELILNGDYRGVYVFMEKIKRDDGRVDIATLNPDEISGDDLTGGYIVKIDKLEGQKTDGWYSPFPPWDNSSHRIYYQYHDPDGSELAVEQRRYIRNHIIDFESLMYSSDYNSDDNGYYPWVHMHSFIDYFIVNEIGRNVDGYRLSTFLYKDKDSNDPRLHLGPIWDFNLAFGNANYYDAWSVEGWQVDFAVQSDGFQIPFYWDKLLADSVFARWLVERWRDLRNTVLSRSQLNATIDSMTTLLQESQQRNFQRWPILGEYIWPNPNPYDKTTYAEEVTYLKDWLRQRTAWMDAHISDYTTALDDGAIASVPERLKLYPNYPNPFNRSTTFTFELSEAMPVRLTIYDAEGKRVFTLFEKNVAVGKHQITWNGNDRANRPVASGVYIAQLTSPGVQKRQKVLLIK